jgi:hydrogenase-4 component B
VTLYILGLGLLLVAGVACAAFRGEAAPRRAFVLLVVAASVLVSIPAIRVLGGGPALEMRWTPSLPGGDWILGIDPLSAIFVVTIALLGATNAVFGSAYMRAGSAPRVARQANATYAVLIASLLLVVAAQNTMLFLCAWELMAISSFLLIITDHEHAAVRRAGWIYIVATHTATLCLFVMFSVWSRGAADLSFASLAATRSSNSWREPAVLLLALGAFGVKTGFVPLHFWLPPAHAAAPSHVSAVMSGIVIKTGIYGILRVLVLVGPPPAWWGWAVLTLGSISALLGVLWALAQHDIKRLLAYHSVENIGIILMGMGIGALGTVHAQPTLVLLGYGAAVLHTVNHALFKSLLFMAAGAVYRRTGTRNLEELGGVAKRMPMTFLLFLIGSIAIIGAPPLNGFVSEWLVYQGLFTATQQDGALRLAILGVPILALVGGLALACFAKASGVVFLGQPRSDHARQAEEVGTGYIIPQAVLAAACVGIGFVPSVVLAPVARVAAFIAGQQAWDVAVIDVVTSAAQRVALFAGTLAGAAVMIAAARYAVVRRRVNRADTTWGCGYGGATPRMQYTASSFAAPLLSIFGSLTGVVEHRGTTVFHSDSRDLVLDGVLSRIWSNIHGAALRLRPMQQGRIHVYLLYVVVALLACLVYLVVAP